VFTGITRGAFEVTLVEREPGLVRYTVPLGELAQGLSVGASVSVDGVCQTVVAAEGGRATFEAVAQTLAVTTLDTLEPGRRVSIERALRAGDELGGHEVSGHVYGTGRVARVVRQGARHELWTEVPASWGKYILARGFIALDGSSLTVADVTHESSVTTFSVHLVPETLRITLLGHKSVGDRVNVELDARTIAIVDTVERVLAERK
jgi:riboflavin synthase